MEAKTLNEIHKQGIDALIKELGPVDAVRFLQIYDPGSGDYTNERKQWLKDDPDKYLAAVVSHGSGDYTKERKKTLRKKTAKQIGKDILELQKSP
jgi:hypothetical protein